MDPPHPLRQHVFSTKNKQKLAFSDPPSPPTSADVIYEWSLGHTRDERIPISNGEAVLYVAPANSVGILNPGGNFNFLICFSL